MKKFKISTGKSRLDTRWQIVEMSWDEFASKLAKEYHTHETTAEYKLMSKAESSVIKDVGGFVGGVVNGGRRIKSSVSERSLVTLDIDYGKADTLDVIACNIDCTYLVYSTHSSTPESPRYRLIIPLDRSVSPDEYEAIARKVASVIGIDLFDDSTYQVERLMYWNSTPVDGEYTYVRQDGELLEADKILSSYVDWRDSTQWAVSSRVRDVVRRGLKKAGDPLDKPGCIGLFCRAYDIHEAISTFLADVYEQTDIDPNRYTYIPGTTSGGMITYDDKFAYSHHGTDPTGGILCNAFDLVRLHLYGDRDEGAKEGVAVSKLPSFAEMEKLVLRDKRVIELDNQERLEKLSEDFRDIPSEEEEKEDKHKWMMDLERDKANHPCSSAKNIGLILDNVKGLKGNIRRNLLYDKITVEEDLPWRRVLSSTNRWTDSDDSNLRIFLESVFGITGREKILDSIEVVASRDSFHPVIDYLKSLEWDGIKRLDEVFIKYLGAEDCGFTRSITRKCLVAAVNRVYEPGCKFDYITVLQGKEGIGKSTLLQKLAGEWFNDSITDLSGKEGMEQIQGSWIVEAGELQGIKRNEVEGVKAFISRRVDDFRSAYGRRKEAHPRQCVFFATTNESNFLKGDAGNRRFWVISCDSKPNYSPWDIDEYERGQIWAEAVRLYQLGEELYLPQEEEEKMRELQKQTNEIATDPRRGRIMEFLDMKLPNDWKKKSIVERRNWLLAPDDLSACEYKRDRVCAAEILCELFGEREDEKTRYKAREINAILDTVPGWKKSNKAMKFGQYGAQKGYKIDENFDVLDDL